MNHRKHKQAENQKRKRMYTPEGYIKDPPIETGKEKVIPMDTVIDKLKNLTDDVEEFENV